MVAPIVVAAVFVLLAFEGLVLLWSEVRNARSEVAYWDARAHRPDLYDWSKDPDL